MAKRIIIIGGVAGGASCAARLRRMDESAEIIILERGEFVSFANCGLPYFVGEVIPAEEDLLLASPELFRERFNIEVRLQNEALQINRDERKVLVKNLKTSEEYKLDYDALVLAPGASPLRPPLPGMDLAGIFSLRSIPDSRQIKNWIAQRKAQRAVVIGAGFIGLEMAENLQHLGLQVENVEMAEQIMPPMDAEMTQPAAAVLREKGITLNLGDGLAS